MSSFKFKVRCSSISKIMSDPKQKSPARLIEDLDAQIAKKESAYNKLKTKDGVMGLKYLEDIPYLKKQRDKLLPRKDEIILSDTCLSHLREWDGYHRHNRSNQLETSVIKKGILGEETSTTLVNELYSSDYDYQELVTSKDREIKRKTDEYKTGECDIHIASHRHIRDIKSSWDYFTFPGGLFHKPKLDKGYHDQMQGYLDLWDADKGFVDYCLIDTPTKLICDRLRKLDWKYGIFSVDGSTPLDEHILLVIELVQKMIYTREGLEMFINDPVNGFDIDLIWFDHPDLNPKGFIEIPAKERVQTYEVERDQDFIESVHERVRLIRKYIDQKVVKLLK